ncbi:MAG: ABC transporter ATP-binding protein [Desulfuromonadaceae bacterium]|nr:ABC transporter ATP-binding protein [Desulfuromonadaceae bacterium]
MQPIEIEALLKTYKNKWGRSIVALQNLNLKVNEGEVFGFLGPNGAGKSTTIKTLVGLIRATAGSVRVFGMPTTNPQCRHRFGYLPENPAFYDFLSARQYLKLVGNCFNMDATSLTTRINHVLELLDIANADCRLIRGYSKGMVQRLGLAQALLHDPDLYILDEPMSGLDPLGRALVKEIMIDLKMRGKTIFFSTHVTADVEAVCDRVAVIVAGKLQAVDDVQDILEKGIDGYMVQLTGCPPSALKEFNVVERPGDVVDVYIPKDELNKFMERVVLTNGRIRLMEPRRRNLEQFFLDIVKRGRL